MGKKNEKIKAERENDIRQTAKQQKLRIQIRKKKIIKFFLIILAIILIASLAWIIKIKTKVQVKDNDVGKYNFFLMKENEKYGVINLSGSVVIKPEYDYIQIPNPEKPIFICLYNYNESNNEYESKVINDKGETLLDEYKEVRAIPRNNTSKKYIYQNNILTYKEGNKYGIITLDGRKVTSAEYDSIETMEYKDGFLKVSKDDKNGLIKLNGDVFIKIKYSSIESDGYYTEQNGYDFAGLIVGTKTGDGYKYGYINYRGKEILESKYGSIKRIIEIKNDEIAYLVTALNGKLGLNKNVQAKINNEYENIEYDDINNIILLEKNGKYGVNDLDGNIILPIQYDNMQFSGKIITAEKDGSQLVFDANGNLQKDSSYISVMPTNSEVYFITIKDNGKYGLVDNNNDVLIDNKYDYIEHAFDNYFIFSNEGKLGIIDNSGTVIIKNQYDIIQRVNGTRIIQIIDSSNNKSYILNKNLKKVLEVKGARIFVNKNYLKIASENAINYLDYDGNVKNVSDIFPENTIFASEKDGKWGYVNISGKVIIDYQYDLTIDINEYGYGAIKKDGKWGVIKSNGEFVLDPTYEIEDENPVFIGEYYKESEDYELSVWVKGDSFFQPK